MVGLKLELSHEIKVLKLITYVKVLDQAQILEEHDQKSKLDG